VLEVTVSAPEWPVKHNLRVGSNRKQVEKALGAGLAVSADCFSYINEAKQDEATICYREAKVKSIKWVKWWDG
jgi:hypothetical protein